MGDRNLTTEDIAGKRELRDDDPAQPSGAEPAAAGGDRGGDPADEHIEPVAADEQRADTASPPDTPRDTTSTDDAQAGRGLASDGVASASRASSTRADDEPLLPDEQTERFTSRWQEIQSGFVDEPRSAVEQADALVADLMQRLAASFSNERARLEGQWDRGDDVSTEDLRVALTRYRSFFDRLLSA